MPTLLVVNSSPFHETSVSRHLSEEFVQNWKQANPNGRVITRDLTSSDLKTVDAAWVGASYTPKDARTAEQKQVLEVSDTLLGELRAADEYVFGVPMHNFGVPSVLKLWIDQVASRWRDVCVFGGRAEGSVGGEEGYIPGGYRRGL
ncbi:FMN-dependent NADH-azoreductase [Tunturiibacter empetritectus]|uniref:FMN-dependent NADH-azoreductase n=1 Tax=Tunturiibacter empetritectus TaxID=3069691 RepID=UPI003D9B9390